METATIQKAAAVDRPLPAEFRPSTSFRAGRSAAC
jgi:hypothetical protein